MSVPAGDTAGGEQKESAEAQLVLPAIDGDGSQGVPGKQRSFQPSEAARNDLHQGGGDEIEGIESREDDLSRLSFDTDLDNPFMAEDSAESPGKLKTMFGAVTEWVDDYKTRKAGYGPPYFTEYGGDLPRDCNRLGADLTEVDELLRNGANPNVGHPEDQGMTPVHFAARFGNVELLKMLKRAGGDPNITSPLGLTPLSYSCAFKLSLSSQGDDSWERQQVAAIRWLLDQGADPNHVDKAGFTPLAWACRSGIYQAVVALVEAGANVMQRRPSLPGGSQVRLPKVDPLTVTTVNQIERYLQAKINAILQREGGLVRREEQVDFRSRRLREIRDAIARRKDARQFVIQEKLRAKQEEELNLELLKVDKANEARKARRDWLRLMKISPGIWIKTEDNVEDLPATPKGAKERAKTSSGTPGSRKRKPRPRWVFDTSKMASKREVAAHDVLEQARQVEAFIINKDQMQKILPPRWRSMTGKRLLRLEHGQRLGAARSKNTEGRRRRGHEEADAGANAHGNGDGDGDGEGDAGGRPLSGLEEEESDSSSSDGGSESDDGR